MRTIKEVIVGWAQTAKKMIEESNNVSGTTYPDNKSTYQDYTVHPTKPEEKK
jgi:hypothetical protein